MDARAPRSRWLRALQLNAREGELPMPRKLPTLRDLGVGDEPEWFPVDGMYGGFSYRLVRRNGKLELLVESWSRVVEALACAIA